MRMPRSPRNIMGLQVARIDRKVQDSTTRKVPVMSSAHCNLQP